jgi:hypothetical protein
MKITSTILLFVDLLQFHNILLEDRSQVLEFQYGLAQITEVQGNRNDALRPGQLCLHIYEAIGHFDTEKVRQWLTWLT